MKYEGGGCEVGKLKYRCRHVHAGYDRQIFLHRDSAKYLRKQVQTRLGFALQLAVELLQTS